MRPVNSGFAFVVVGEFNHSGEQRQPATDMAELVGKDVVLHSLVGRPELNGKRGVVLSFDAERGRAGVHVDGENLAVRPAHLSPAPPRIGSEMDGLVVAVQALCVQSGPGWQSAKNVHAELQKDAAWSGTTLGQVKAACAIAARSQGRPPPPETAGSAAVSVADSVPEATDGAATGVPERVAQILQTLRASMPGTEERRAHAEELLALLREHGSKRSVTNALIDGEGPEILYAIENSMQGDWKTDARNGTLARLGEIMRLPGPAGLAVAQYCNMTSARVQAAAKGQHDACEH